MILIVVLEHAGATDRQKVLKLVEPGLDCSNVSLVAHLDDRVGLFVPDYKPANYPVWLQDLHLGKLAFCTLDQRMIRRVPDIVTMKAKVLGRYRTNTALSGHIRREVGVIRDTRDAHLFRMDINPLIRKGASLDHEIDPYMIPITQRTACRDDLRGWLRGHHLENVGQWRAYQKLASLDNIAL